MGQGVRHVAIALARITGLSSEERETVIDLLGKVATRGRGVGELHAPVLAGLGLKDFGWPEFDRWQAFFADRGKFPPLWDELKTTPPRRASSEHRDAYCQHKLRLLLDWLQSFETTREALAHYARRGIRAEITRQGDGAPCPVCDPFNHWEVKGMREGLPPFHPGCRCLIVAITDARVLARRGLPYSR